jgi:hypothetical protein
MTKRILCLAAAAVMVVISHASVAQADDGLTPAFDVSPTGLVAGSSVRISGQCQTDEEPFVFAHYLEDESFSGALRPNPAPDGSFSTLFPIPGESAGGTWQFRLSCFRDDVGRPSSSVDVAVTPDHPEPLAVDLAPLSPWPGGTLDVSGRGCAATGRGLDEVIVSLSLPINNTAPDVRSTVSPDASGAFHVVLRLPDAYPEGKTYVSLDCRDVRVTDDTPSWRRWLSQPITVIAGPPPTSTTTSTSTSASLAAEAEGSKRELPRTGLPLSMLAGAGVLLLVGLALVSATARPRRGTKGRHLGS